jgi:hypothetical protein
MNQNGAARDESHHFFYQTNEVIWFFSPFLHNPPPGGLSR